LEKKDVLGAVNLFNLCNGGRHGGVNTYFGRYPGKCDMEAFL
jgi:hypothetical protein